jgi:hypothetical protein
MPERWQHELEKLRTVGAPSSMRNRIEAGPTGDGVPPMPGRRQRIVAGVVAFAVFGGAVAFAWGAFGRSGSGTTVAAPSQDAAVFTFAAHPTEGGANPTGTMRFGDETTIQAFGASFCWDFGGGSMCADTVEPEFADSDFGSVPAGTPIAIEGDAESVDGRLDAAGSFPFDRIRSLNLSDSPVLPTEAGRYVLEFTATWSQGERAFYFPILIIDASAPDPSILVATMSAPADGSMPGLVLAYDGRSQDYFAQGGAWPGVDGFDQPLLGFVPSIEPGSVIRVGGDARDVNGVLRVVGDDGSLTDEEISLDLSSGTARLPGEPGTFELVLKGTWDRGVAVFSVRIDIGEPTVSEPSASPALPDLVGMGDQQAMRTLDGLGLTWVIAYRASSGEPWRVVATTPAPGTPAEPGSQVYVVVTTEVTPLPDGAEGALACPFSDHVAFGGPRLRIEPGGSAYIVGNIGGIERSDDVVQVTFTDQQWYGIWHVIRDGAVIAVVDFDSLDGIACAGSGVGAA